jgi:1,4-dihydroxy-2-naphthoate octaprenyltransferase
MLNEVGDYHSGLDDMTVRTPFSGGSGRLQAYPHLAPQAAKWVRNVAWLLILLVVLDGFYLMLVKGWGLLPLGALGLLLIVSYTHKITRHPWLCLIAPGLAFGPLMVLGSYYVFTGYFSWSAFAVSLVPFFLVNNLLLLNQLPDEAADRAVGRFNLIMLLGAEKSLAIFRLFLLGSYLMLLILVAVEFLPIWALLGGLSLILAIPLFFKIHRAHRQLDRLIPLLTWNVIINIITPLLMALGLYLGGYNS